jgi:hypothetical protein
MAITLTQVLQIENKVRLFGRTVSDFVVRGDLGLGHDPAGPLVFAWIVAYARGDGRTRSLAQPLLVSVPGAGEVVREETLAGLVAGAPLWAASVERSWLVHQLDEVVSASLRRVALTDLLNPPEPGA